MSTVLSQSKRFYTTIDQYPTLYDFLAITQEDLIQWEYHLDNPNMSTNLKIFQPTLLPPLYSGEMSHHMHDSGECIDSSACHTIIMTSLSVCQSHDLSVCHTIIMTSPSICQSHDSSVCHTINMTSPSVCQSYDSSVCHTTTQQVCLYVSHITHLSVIPSS